MLKHYHLQRLNLVLKIHPEDNVLVALSNLKKGTNISFSNSVYKLNQTVKSKHKFSIKKLDIARQKYGLDINDFSDSKLGKIIKL